MTKLFLRLVAPCLFFLYNSHYTVVRWTPTHEMVELRACPTPPLGHDGSCYTVPVSYTHLDVYKRQARKRRNKVTSVDKANVLETSRMWREIVHRVHDEEYALSLIHI